MNRSRFLFKSLVHGAGEWTGRPARRRRELAGSLIILTYHSFCLDWQHGLFNRLPVDRFERQLRFLKRHFEVVSLEQGLANIQSGLFADKPLLSLTIDDGYQDNYTLAWPMLRRYEVPATTFLVTDFLDSSRPPWPTQLVEIFELTDRLAMSFPFKADFPTHLGKVRVVQHIKNAWKGYSVEERFSLLEELRNHLGVHGATRYLPLTWDQVRRMREQGASFGSHTAYHSILSAVNRDIGESELRESKRRLEAELKTPCRLFAYPDGQRDESCEHLLKSMGFVAAVTQERGPNGPEVPPLRLKRIEVPYHDPLVTFRGRVSLAW